MSTLPIVQLTESLIHSRDTTLRQTCRKITVEDPGDLALAQSVIEEMFKALYSDPSSVALAAPQIGVLLQIAVVSYQDTETNEQHLMALINPVLSLMSDETNESEEICLSVPNLTGRVRRANAVKVAAYTQFGERVEFDAENWLARVMQHEIDHLQGTLYVDKVTGKLRKIPDYPERRSQRALKQLTGRKLLLRE